MGVRKIETETTYRASDGREFNNEEHAKRHERLISIRDEYTVARQAYARALAESFKTADGKDFRIDRWHYYRLTPWYGDLPQVQEIHLSGRDLDIPENDPDEGSFLFKVNGPDGKRELRKVNISNLYCTLAAANKACVAAQRGRLEELREQVESNAALYGVKAKKTRADP